jgi:outer membrane protein TolC
MTITIPLVLGLPGLPLGAQDGGEALRVADVLAAVEVVNPGLDAMRISAEAMSLRGPAASAFPDPLLQLGFMNFGLPEFNTDMAMSMAPSVQLTQTLPWPGKLSRQEDVALFERDMAFARADEASWQLRKLAAAVVYDLYALDRRLAVMTETLELLGGFREVALAMYGTGTGRQTDVLRADVEITRMAGEVRRMEGMRSARVATLNGMLDRPTETPVGAVVLEALPRTLPEQDTLIAWALEGRPLLTEATLAVQRAESATSRAEREIWPDLRVGVAYGQRDRGFGTERMGSVLVGVTLPIFAGSRQHALKNAAAAEGRAAEARLSSARAEVGSLIGRLLAELDATRALVDLYRDEVVPQAQTNVASAFSSYRVGVVDFMTLIDAQTTANRYEAELYQLISGYGATVVAIESAVGRPLPVSPDTLTESR